MDDVCGLGRACCNPSSSVAGYAVHVVSDVTVRRDSPPSSIGYGAAKSHTIKAPPRLLFPLPHVDPETLGAVLLTHTTIMYTHGAPTCPRPIHTHTPMYHGEPLSSPASACEHRRSQPYSKLPRARRRWLQQRQKKDACPGHMHTPPRSCLSPAAHRPSSAGDCGH